MYFSNLSSCFAVVKVLHHYIYALKHVSLTTHGKDHGVVCSETMYSHPNYPGFSYLSTHLSEQFQDKYHDQYA